MYSILQLGKSIAEVDYVYYQLQQKSKLLKGRGLPYETACESCIPEFAFVHVCLRLYYRLSRFEEAGGLRPTKWCCVWPLSLPVSAA